MNVARQGFRVVFDERARAWDSPDLGTQREFRRKVRTLTGNYQLLQLAPWLLRRENPLRFEFISHKLMRLVVPFALVAALAAAWFLPGPFYRVAFWAQLGFYGLELVGMDWVESRSGVATRRSRLHVCGVEYGCPSGVCELRNRTQGGVDARPAPQGDSAV